MMTDYVRLLEANNAIQTIGDDTYWLCVTRTVQESKLFPVPSYMLLSYLCCFYRYPELLRKVEAVMPAEEVGDRSRLIGGKLGNLPGWALPTFYLLGREILINFGMLAPEDAAEDVAYVMDFWRRFKLAQQREDGHLNAREFGQRVQHLPERRVQRFHSELLPCKPGDRLGHAAQAFLATVSQYGFLVSCESRCALNNSGPYRLAEDREMIIRDFSDLAEGDYPWLDGVAGDIPFSNLTVTMEATGCQFYLMDDWGSFESRPEFTADKLTGVGLYTSDALSGGYIPVGMGSAEELAATFEDLTDRIRKATVELWKRTATWSRDEMMDAGALVYFSLIKEIAHIAGVYDVNDWMTIDPRADRFRSLFNDEFGRDFLGEMVGLVSLPSQQLNRYAMMQHNNNPVRYISQIPYSVLQREGTGGKLAPIGPGVSHLPPKQDLYTTTAGRLPLAEYNARARALQPAQMAPEYRFICDTTAKFHPDDAQVQALYRLEQEGSPLAGRGVGLSRDDVEAIRSARA
ncbi:hypothetical protein NRB_20000 [Novosphingobium sp. 11B]|uniref:Uncharacterized protein n=2 Tax=Sphingomonadaceae TaxID=41297 RepID=A0A031JAR2_9SPHN|nr:hypothetical protein BES08_23040 [Novosphingobium resinovorum]EZP71229.1 hypothetical protein BV97_05222 [Novosphingobium resinovorum]MBF7013381.1 hypothetical protein [Novosphingobium sp. HR1a]